MKKSRIKKAISLILAQVFILTLLVSVYPQGMFNLEAWAAGVGEWMGAGTSEDPYIIYDAEGLAKLATNVNSGTYYYNKYFKLGCDIDLSDYLENEGNNEGAGWQPIGNEDNRFQGTFDGGGYAVKGLWINRPETDYIGLFGSITGGGIRNLGLEIDNAAGGVKGNAYVGGLVGYQYAAIVGSYATGDVHGESDNVGGLVGRQLAAIDGSNATGNVEGNAYVGGLVGYQYGDDSTVTNSYATGDVYGKSNYVGGLVGWQRAAIVGSYATGNVQGISYVGGLVGYQYAAIVGSYATGNVHGANNFVGGLVGDQRAAIVGSYATGDVEGSSSVGGLVGYQRATIDGSNATGNVEGNAYVGGLVGYQYGDDSTVTNSYATGDVYGKSNYVGGLVGWQYAAIDDSYATGNVQGKDSVGGLVGDQRAAIKNSYATGNVKGTSFVGGLVGDQRAAIKNSYATGNVRGEIDNVGGLVGRQYGGTIESCYATGNVYGEGNLVGGLVGRQESGAIESSYATGNVEGNSYVGGLVGRQENGSITNCYATGNVKGGYSIGGLVGWQNGSIINCYSICSVSGTGYYISAFVGFRNGDLKIIENCFYSTSRCTLNAVGNGGDADITGLISKNMYYEPLENAMANINADDAFYWIDRKNETHGCLGTEFYPELRVFAESKDELTRMHSKASVNNGSSNCPLDDHKNEQHFVAGSGTSDDPYLVFTAGQLSHMRRFYDKGAYYKIIADINLSDFIAQDDDPNDPTIGWEPIGHYISAGSVYTFQGHLDGNNHRIYGLWINRSNKSDIGLFGEIKNTSITNLVLEVDEIKGDDLAYYVGGLVGYADNSSIKNCRVLGIVTSTKTSPEYGYPTGSVGGIAGSVYNTDIIGCYNTATVTGGSNTGGIAGFVDISNIVDCYNEGTVQQNYIYEKDNVNVSYSGFSLGGIVGRLIDSTIQKCYNSANVSHIFEYTGNRVNIQQNINTGGLAGYVNSSSITNSFNSGNVMITGIYDIDGYLNIYTGGLVGCQEDDDSLIENCYNTGNVNNTLKSKAAAAFFSYTGGLVGYQFESTIKNCYATGNVQSIIEGGYTAVNIIGGLVGYQDYGTVKNCYYNSDNTISANYHGTPLTTTEMLTNGKMTLSDNWTAISCDDNYAYYPQLSVFAENLSTQAQSKKSVQVTRRSATLVNSSATDITHGQTLSYSNITTTATDGSATVAGNSAWQNGTITPDAGTQSYAAVFTPESLLYKAIEHNVEVKIHKAQGANVSQPTATTVTENSITVTLTPPANQSVEYAISLDNTAPSSWQTSVTFNGLTPYTDYYIFARSAENDNYLAGTPSQALLVKTIDATAPTGEIAIGYDAWDSFLTTITFGWYSKTQVNVTITANDTASGVDTIEYLLSQNAYTKEDVKNLGGWQTYAPFTINANWKGYIYAKITDVAGNMTIIRSDGVVIFSDSVAVTTVINHTKQSGNKTAEVNLNGNTIAKIADPNRDLVPNTDYTVDGNTITFMQSYLDGLAKGSYVLTISYNPLGEPVDNASSRPDNTTIALNISLASQTIEINGLITSYTYGHAPFMVSPSGVQSTGEIILELVANDGVASISGDIITILKAGTFKLQATVKEDSRYAETVVTSDLVTVQEATPSVTLSGDNVAYENDVELSVTVSGAGATPEGTVVFKRDGVQIGTATLVNGMASYTDNKPMVGSYSYTVEFLGQTDYYTAASGAKTIGVGKVDQAPISIQGVPDTVTYGDADFTLSIIGGSGSGNVIFTAQDNNVLSITPDGKVTIIKAGTAIVSVEKTYDNNYNSQHATVTITVNKRSITHAIVTITGDTTYTGSKLMPTFDVWDEGAAINQGDYNNTYGDNIIAGQNTASVTLTGQNNYEGTLTVEFDIQRMVVTVTADNQEKSFGDPDPALTYTANPPLASGDTLTGSLKYEGSAVGSYDIVEDEALANPNYDITFVSGTMTINLTEAMETIIDRINNLPNDDSSNDFADEVADITREYEKLSDEEKEQIPNEIKEKLQAAQTKAGEINHTNEVVATSDLPWNVRIVASIIPQTDARFGEFFGKLSEKELLVLYEIKLIDTLTGEVYAPEQAVTIILDTLLDDGAEVAVAHQKADGTIEYLTATVEGGKLTFEATAFSLYGITQAKPLPDTSDRTAFPMIILAILSAAIVVTLERRKNNA